MQKSSSLFPAEVLMWSLLAQCERQIFDHEMPPPATTESAPIEDQTTCAEPEKPHC